MERREFVKSALVTAGMASGTAFGADPNGKGPAEARQEFYQLRKYALRTGPQIALTQGYFEKALIPALNRLEMGPVGAFKVTAACTGTSRSAKAYNTAAPPAEQPNRPIFWFAARHRRSRSAASTGGSSFAAPMTTGSKINEA